MPPKKKNKPSKNGFFCFMLEIKQSRKLTMQEAQEVAGPMWKNMPPEERRPYDEQAMSQRDHYQQSKYTSDGIKIDDLKKQEEEKEQKEEQMKEATRNRIETAIGSDAIYNEVFFLIHMNKLIYHITANKYYVGEIAIAPFCLTKGIDHQNIFHRIVRPGNLPLGYKAEVKINSADGHELANLVFDKEPFICNMEEVFCDMIHFITHPRYKGKSDVPILYAHERDMEMVENVISHWCLDYGYSQDIKIHNLQYMFYVLRNASAGRAVWPTDTYSYVEIEKDGYCHVPDISCDYHENTDRTIYCSKSIVTRCAYTICDFCCGDLGIPLKPGVHVPCNSVVKLGTSRRNSQGNFNEYVNAHGYYNHFPPLGKSEAESSFNNFNPVEASSRVSKTESVEDTESAFSDLEETSIRGRDFSKLKFPKKGCATKRNN